MEQARGQVGAGSVCCRNVGWWLMMISCLKPQDKPHGVPEASKLPAHFYADLDFN